MNDPTLQMADFSHDLRHKLTIQPNLHDIDKRSLTHAFPSQIYFIRMDWAEAEFGLVLEFELDFEYTAYWLWLL